MSLELIAQIPKKEGIRSSLLSFVMAAEDPSEWIFTTIEAVQHAKCNLQQMVNMVVLPDDTKASINKLIEDTSSKIINRLES